MEGPNMNRLCKWFHRYQDGDLPPAELEQFRQHLTVCDSCRTSDYFLNNIAQAIRKRKPPEPRRGPEQISAVAFRNLHSWDALSFYWPKPAKVWIAFAAMLMLVSLLWLRPSVQESGINDQYEMLMTDSDLSVSNQNILITPTDDEIVRWLEQGGDIQ